MESLGSEVDRIQRHGGEEFAVIMPETSLQAAIQVVVEIRRHFANLDHRAGDQLFTVTLSGGIATCPPRADVGELCEAADQMLYQAKQNGVPERRA